MIMPRTEIKTPIVRGTIFTKNTVNRPRMIKDKPTTDIRMK